MEQHFVPPPREMLHGPARGPGLGQIFVPQILDFQNCKKNHWFYSVFGVPKPGQIVVPQIGRGTTSCSMEQLVVPWNN
jgi:hypothetical protein